MAAGNVVSCGGIGGASAQADCTSPTVYAIDGSDAAGVSAFIGDINHCGEPIQTNSGKWKCSPDCPDGWTAVGFDDTAWCDRAREREISLAQRAAKWSILAGVRVVSQLPDRCRHFFCPTPSTAALRSELEGVVVRWASEHHWGAHAGLTSEER